ncbi:hypothetical protein HK100_006899 [Physocladia obscura]|uniref:Uncharacterized protein n=1 Tax=Physocladia obscura TaxID=109957 RepID=A0AAD5SPZ2_9FUNG|nr:hypothetical protein HK100_006899 [Physocladia obscura]
MHLISFILSSAALITSALPVPYPAAATIDQPVEEVVDPESSFTNSAIAPLESISVSAISADVSNLLPEIQASVEKPGTGDHAATPLRPFNDPAALGKIRHGKPANFYASHYDSGNYGYRSYDSYYGDYNNFNGRKPYGRGSAVYDEYSNNRYGHNEYNENYYYY